jgi:CBS domain-containing protein
MNVLGCVMGVRRHGLQWGGRWASSRASTVRDLLAEQRAGSVKFVSSSDTVTVAAQQMTNNRVTSLAVKDASTRRVVGLVTQGDLVRCLATRMTAEHFSLAAEAPPVEWGEGSDVPQPTPVSWDVLVSSIMTRTRDVVYLTPEDSVEEAHALFATSGKRHIPVLSGSTLLGMPTPNPNPNPNPHPSPHGFDSPRYANPIPGPNSNVPTLCPDRAHDARLCGTGIISSMTVLRGLQPHESGSAKDRFVSTVISRRGVPRTTQLDQPALGQVQRLAIGASVSNLPHPHKGTDGEDAYLLSSGMLGVADGVVRSTVPSLLRSDHTLLGHMRRTSRAQLQHE